MLDSHVVENLETGVDVPRCHVGPFEIPLKHRFLEWMLHACPVDGAAAAGLSKRRSFNNPRALSLDLFNVKNLTLVGSGGPLRP